MTLLHVLGQTTFLCFVVYFTAALFQISSATMQPLSKLIQKDSAQVQGRDRTKVQSLWMPLQRICLSVGLCQCQKAVRGITGLLPRDNDAFVMLSQVLKAEGNKTKTTNPIKTISLC